MLNIISIMLNIMLRTTLSIMPSLMLLKRLNKSSIMRNIMLNAGYKAERMLNIISMMLNIVLRTTLSIMPSLMLLKGTTKTA